MRVTVSERLRLEIWRKRAEGIRLYQIARQAKVDRSVASALINSITLPRENDPRVIAIGAVVGLSPEECFGVLEEA